MIISCSISAMGGESRTGTSQPLGFMNQTKPAATRVINAASELANNSDVLRSFFPGARSQTDGAILHDHRAVMAFVKLTADPLVSSLVEEGADFELGHL